MATKTRQEVASDVPAHRLIAAILKGELGGARPDLGEVPERTLEHLDWSSLCEAIAERCVLAETMVIAEALPLLRREDLVMRRLCEIEAMAHVIRGGERPPLRLLEEGVRSSIDRASLNAVLSAEDLRSIGELASCSSASQKFLRARAEEHPILGELLEDLESLDPVASALQGIFDPNGGLTDAASPALRRLRRRLRQLHDEMRGRIEKRMRDKDTVIHLQDTYYTQREGRYVLPVKSSSRGRVHGIVHAASASGQTVFVEPADIVVLNNDLRIAEFEVREEILRILEHLSKIVGQHVEALVRNLDRLVYLDLLHASAEFCCLIDASAPELGGREVMLEDARHPLLALRFNAEERALVANDILISAESPLLVISGSNAGGKTVTLKTMGLFALMTRAGLMISAAAESAMPLYENIFTDIGDEQSIENDTSTFSAHLLNLGSFVEKINARSLVLLDEPFAGTDPAHAAALAISLLEHINFSQTQAMVTTHLDKIKVFALETPWLANASVGFDVEALRPTYRLHLGVPGGSCALQIARRLSFSEKVTRRAEALLAEDPKMSIENILRELENERSKLEEQRSQIEIERGDVIKLQRRLERELEKARRNQIEALDEEGINLRKELKEARQSVASHIKMLQNASAPSSGRKTKRGNDQRHFQKIGESLRDLSTLPSKVAEKVRDAQSPASNKPALKKTLIPGDIVWSKTYQREGEVVSYDARRKSVTLQLGQFRVTVKLDDLRGDEKASQRAQKQRRRKRRSKGGSTQSAAAALGAAAPINPSGQRQLLPQTSENACDLRGMNADEAIERLELFLDWAYGNNVGAIYAIHGHGTGILKRAVRQFAPKSRYIEYSRAGEYREGGDGVTIMWLNP